MKNFIDELKWRGMLQDIIPGTETHLNKNKSLGYIGFDPTSDSLHVGSLVPIFILMHFQSMVILLLFCLEEQDDWRSFWKIR